MRLKTRRRKPSAAQQKVIDQVLAAIPHVLERIETQEQADQMETHIWKLRTAGQLSDQKYQEYLNAIKQIYKENNWEHPTT